MELFYVIIHFLPKGKRALRERFAGKSDTYIYSELGTAF